MFHSSRTTLKELKKRYLNILKKCLLANLMAFSFALPSVAETVTDPATNEELLQALLDPTTQVQISSSQNLIVSGLEDTQIQKDTFNTYGNFLRNYGSVTFIDEINIYDSKNTLETNGSIWVGLISNENTAELTFRNNVFVKNMTMALNDGTIRGAFRNGGKIIFEKDLTFENITAVNKGSTTIAGTAFSNFYGGEAANAIFKGKVYFINIYNKNEGGQICGALLTNQNSNLYFYDDVYFLNNTAISKGDSYGAGATFWGAGINEFNGKTYLINNKGLAGKNGSGGATNGGVVFFNNDLYVIGNLIYSESTDTGISSMGGGLSGIYASFAKSYFYGNKAISKYTFSVGGAIATSRTLTFNSDFSFAGNVANLGKDIYLSGSGHMNVVSKNDEVGTIEGGIAGEITAGINKFGIGFLVLGDNSENHEYEGAFTQTAGTTIANSERFFSHENAVNTINGGELKTHGSEIAYKATLGETGTLTHLGSSADTPTEIKGVTFNGTGLNLTLGTYTKAEQEKEIALVGDRLVEYVDENGETICYQAADKLFTINALENDQKAKFILKENLAGMEGNTLTIDNAELDVAEGLKVLGTVVAKDMTLSKGTPPVSFTEVTVAKEGLLDIGTREMNVDSMTLQEGATLKIALNSLQEHGKVNGLITGTATSQIALNLATDVEMGIYQLFDQDNDISLKENLFFNIKDLENGSYEIGKKSTGELVSTFGSETQAKTAAALLGGGSEHESFSKMQSEILAGLQSTDKAQVEKAKKALKAVGTSEQSSAQSVSTDHVDSLANIVQGEMQKAGFGRSGGEEEARAKVYIKGLYDKTKSTMGDGFKARSTGAVLGIQSEVTESLTLGVGYATSQTTAKEELRRIEVDTNTGFISAHYQPNAWWMSGVATFSRGQYDEEKQVLSSVGTANYDVDSWGVQVMTGYDIKLENTVITPEVGLRYLAVKQEGYTDTLGTTVEATSSDYLTAIVGVKGAWDLGKIRPTVGINVGYDVISDDVSALNTLANGASYTVNSEALDRLSVGISTGVEAKLNDRTTLKLEYNGSFRKEYTDHSGMLKLELKF